MNSGPEFHSVKPLKQTHLLQVTGSCAPCGLTHRCFFLHQVKNVEYLIQIEMRHNFYNVTESFYLNVLAFKLLKENAKCHISSKDLIEQKINLLFAVQNY